MPYAEINETTGRVLEEQAPLAWRNELKRFLLDLSLIANGSSSTLKPPDLSGLSDTIAVLDTNQTFAGNQTFNGTFLVNAGSITLTGSIAQILNGLYIETGGSSTLGLELKQMGGQSAAMIRIKDSSNNVLFQIMPGGLLYSTQPTKPTIAAGTALGNTGTAVAVVAASSDLCGKVQLTSGALALTTGVAATITFNGTYSSAPKMVQLTPASSGAPARLVYATNVTATTFDIAFDVAPILSTQYDYFYLVIQ